MRRVALAFALTATLASTTARADAVGMFDPELAQICGGSMHHPGCSSDQAFLAVCCCGGFGLAAIGVLVFFTMGRRGSRPS